MKYTSNQIERRVVHHILTSLLYSAYSVMVSNGETLSAETSDYKTAHKAMFTSDKVRLLTSDADGKRGFIDLYYGDGENVIHDYSVSLGYIIAPINEWLATKGFMKRAPKPARYPE